MDYFAGANTRNGFVSLFDEAFSDVKKLYILKGSSGCGKSTLMKRIAGRAQKLGIPTDIIYCSADPESLDGVVIPLLGIAVADGTSPHVMDVKYPCVRETIINLGQFWDESKIIPHRDEIIALTDAKSRHYQNAYRCLSAIGSVNDLAKQLVTKHIDRAKLDSVTFKLAEKIANDKKGSINCLFSSAFTASGLKILPVFGEVKTLYNLNGRGSDELLTALYGVASEQGLPMTVSRSAIDPSVPDSLFFPESSTLITSLPTPPCRSAATEKTLSSARYIKVSELNSAKNRLKGLDKLSLELSGEAQKELSSAKSVHNDIEAIYIPAMNFTLLDEYTLSLIDSIFGNK